MNAAELIAELQKLEPSTPVFMRSYPESDPIAVARVAIEPHWQAERMAVLEWVPATSPLVESGS
jgi:hypothetical protein